MAIPATATEILSMLVDYLQLRDDPQEPDHDLCKQALADVLEEYGQATEADRLRAGLFTYKLYDDDFTFLIRGAGKLNLRLEVARALSTLSREEVAGDCLAAIVETICARRGYHVVVTDDAYYAQDDIYSERDRRYVPHNEGD